MPGRTLIKVNVVTVCSLINHAPFENCGLSWSCSTIGQSISAFLPMRRKHSSTALLSSKAETKKLSVVRYRVIRFLHILQ